MQKFDSWGLKLPTVLLYSRWICSLGDPSGLQHILTWCIRLPPPKGNKTPEGVKLARAPVARLANSFYRFSRVPIWLSPQIEAMPEELRLRIIILADICMHADIRGDRSGSEDTVDQEMGMGLQFRELTVWNGDSLLPRLGHEKIVTRDEMENQHFYIHIS